MSSVSGAFSAAMSSIRANRTAIEITGANIANVNTEGYTKQRIVFAPNSGGGVGQGVSIEAVERDFNRFTEAQLTNITQRKGSLETENRYLQYLEDIFQEGEGQGISGAITGFFNAYSAVASNPSNINERQNLVIQAQRLGQEFARVDRWVRDLRTDANKEIKALVDDLNIKLNSLKEVNYKIERMRGQGGTANELMDERVKLIRDISGIVDCQAIETEFDFQLLVAGNAVVFNHEASSFQVKSDAQGDARIFVIGDRGGAGVDITESIKDGNLKGTLTVRDTYLPKYLDHLNSLAHNIVDEVNSVHQQGYGLDGVGGRTFFNPIGATETDLQYAAANVSLNPQIVDNPIRIAASDNPTEIPYNNTVAIAIANLANKAIDDLNDQTFVANYGTLLESIGLDAQGIKKDYNTQEDFFTQMKIRRQSEAGVSVDEEATNLIIYQKAFEASARVINVATELLELLTTLGG